MNGQPEEIISCMKELGCAPGAMEQAARMMREGKNEELIRQLRCCRCDLMDELHESQRRVDRMDYLIRQTEKNNLR